MNDIKSKIDYVIENLMYFGAVVNINSLMKGGGFIYIDTLDGTNEKVEIICTDRTDYRFMAGKNCVKINGKYRPGTYIDDINTFITDVGMYIYDNAKNTVDTELLSMKALRWLQSIGYSKKSHEERLTLIEAARVAYPN